MLQALILGWFWSFDSVWFVCFVLSVSKAPRHIVQFSASIPHSFVYIWICISLRFTKCYSKEVLEDMIKMQLFYPDMHLFFSLSYSTVKSNSGSDHMWTLTAFSVNFIVLCIFFSFEMCFFSLRDHVCESSVFITAFEQCIVFCTDAFYQFK